MMTFRSERLVMAVDPDIELCGWAVVDKAGKTITHGASGVFDVIEYVSSMAGTVTVWVEAGWLNGKSNFHGGTVCVAQRIAKNVGENHAAGKLLVEGLRRSGADVRLAAPLRKCWRGSGGKISAAELNGILSAAGYSTIGRSNQDVRDAVLLALVCSGERVSLPRGSV